MPRPSATWPSGSGRPRGIFDLETKERRATELESLTSAPGFWDDQSTAQKVLREADSLRSEITLWRDLASRADNLLTTLELVEESGDAELTTELEREAASLESDFARDRTQLLF